MEKSKSIRLVSLWQREAKSGKVFFSGNNITLAEIRDIFMKLKEEEGATDHDNIAFLMFPTENDNPKAPTFDLILKKDNWKKD